MNEMVNIGQEMQALLQRMKTGSGGTRSYEPKLLTPEEKAIRDAKDLNSEIGHEDQIDGYFCEKCRNRGYIYSANGRYVSRTDCTCMKARNSIRRMQRSGLEKVISKYTFDNYQDSEEWQKRIKASARRFLGDDGSRWFFIGGQSGGGKSHICTAICRILLASEEVHYMMWEEEAVELKASVNDPDVYQAKMIRLKNVDVLYIDDFFSGKRERNGEVSMPTFADVRLAREILNHRYVNGKTTIISSEWYSAEICEIDAALGGRIIEMAGIYCLNIGRSSDKNFRIKMGGDTV